MSNPWLRRAVIASVVLITGLAVGMWSQRDSDSPGLDAITVESLQRAQALWKTKKPANYVSELRKKTKGLEPETLVVTIESGTATELTIDGRKTGQAPYYSMEGLLWAIEADVTGAAQEGPRSRWYGRFHPELGYPVETLRIVDGSATTVHLEVVRFEAGTSEPDPPPAR